ncbi:MAG: UvrD-helicase domain-containing protein [Pseudomonadota bacterium]
MSLPGLEQNAVIAASAGTGKTQLLTGIYLAFALGLRADGKQVPTERIVATTFSRAAAAEIRERLELRLSLLSNAETLSRDSLAALAIERGLSEKELCSRARRVLEELPRATIDTLHGLATNILRRHALELGLSPNFTILDEEKAFADAERSIDDVLDQALAGPLSTATSRLLDACYGLDRARNEITVLLGRLDEEGLPADELAVGDHVADAKRQLAELRAVCQSIAHAEPSALSDPARAALNALDAGNFAALRSALLELSAVRAGKSIRNLPFWPALEQFQESLSGGTKRERLESLVEHAERAEQLDADARGASQLLATIQRTLIERRRAEGTLSFGDVLRLARDGLRDQPSLAKSASQKTEVLLVDEFQDTSRVQRDLLLLLRERPSSIDRRRPGQVPTAQDILPRGLVVVGDRKQSIYAFRGAEVSVFAQLAAELAGAPAAQQLELRGVLPSSAPVAEFHTLTANYRSQRAIIDAVNAIASADFCERPERAFEIRYTPAEALLLPAGAEEEPQGTVTIVEDDGSAPTDPALPALLRQAEGTLRSAFAAAGLCAKIARGGTRFADVALLARRRATLPMLELALDRLNIPFVVAGRALYATPEVRDLFAALRLQIDPGNRHALAVLARGPLGGLSDRALAELCTPRRGLDPVRDWSSSRLSDPLEHEALNTLRERLLEIGQVAPRLSPRDALSVIADRFQLEALYSLLPRGRTRFGNVERLLEIAARQGGSLQSFVRWLERQIANETDEAEAAVFSDEDDAVRLLTIHGSKGLAFPTTIVLDTGSWERPNSAPIGLLRGDRETSLVIRHVTDAGSLATPLSRRATEDSLARARAERQRLSYVALTRARSHLAIVLPAGKLRADSLAASIVGAGARLDGIAGVTRVAAHSLFGEPPFSAIPSDTPPAAPPPRPPRPRVTLATIGVTALSDFAICARRFELAHLFSLAEPRAGARVASPSGEDPRALGSAAHRVLEAFPSDRWGTRIDPVEIAQALAREGLDPDAESSAGTARGIAGFLAGAYARSVQEDGSRIRRELSLGIPFRSTPAEPKSAPVNNARARGRRVAPGQLELFALRPRTNEPDPELLSATVVLKATLDLVIERADGSIDVIDYKRSRGGDEDRYSFQLAAYREAAKRHFGVDRIRTGLVHLLGEHNEPDWQTPPEFDFFELGTRLIEARFHDLWPAIVEPACRKAQCGFVSACHAPSRAAPRRPSDQQND